MASENTARLRRLLQTEARVDPRLIEYMVDTLGMDSITDFANHFTQTDYQDGVQTEILDKMPDLQASRIQRGRLRTAWELARAEFTHALLKVRSSPDEVELDAPLAPEV